MNKFKYVTRLSDMDFEFCWDGALIQVGLEGLYPAEVVAEYEPDEPLVEQLNDAEFFAHFCDEWAKDYGVANLTAQSLSMWYAESELREIFGPYAPSRVPEPESDEEE